LDSTKNDSIKISIDEFKFYLFGLARGVFYMNESYRKDSIIIYKDSTILRNNKLIENANIELAKKPTVVTQVNWFITLTAVVITSILYLSTYLLIDKIK